MRLEFQVLLAAAKRDFDAFAELVEPAGTAVCDEDQGYRVRDSTPRSCASGRPQFRRVHYPCPILRGFGFFGTENG